MCVWGCLVVNAVAVHLQGLVVGEIVCSSPSPCPDRWVATGEKPPLDVLCSSFSILSSVDDYFVANGVLPSCQ
ncbi:hypothetical protein DE146DRAFT_663658 [Phaeosphaeria sp. MPI-PUGE-AT-0046c]|nr:hypothetical protein DE146DRAFT_663658 [Phaeosphaeria sp. MPI-PUGE-AT-0046c]